MFGLADREQYRTRPSSIRCDHIRRDRTASKRKVDTIADRYSSAGSPASGENQESTRPQTVAALCIAGLQKLGTVAGYHGAALGDFALAPHALSLAGPDETAEPVWSPIWRKAL
jgi:hypothetical protein